MCLFTAKSWGRFYEPPGTTQVTGVCPRDLERGIVRQISTFLAADALFAGPILSVRMNISPRQVGALQKRCEISLWGAHRKLPPGY